MKLGFLFATAVFGTTIDIDESDTVRSVAEKFESAELEQPFDEEELGNGLVRSGGGIEERNFKKWKVLLKFFNRENPAFSYKHLAMYGCQCGALGKDGKYDFYGRGAGQPLDELDEACKEYSSCLKCLGEAHGDECSPSSRYKLRLDTDAGSATCRAKEGSCKQNLCKCDTQFAERVSAVYSSSYGAEKTGYDRSQCVRGASTGQPKQCCGTKDTFPLNRPYRAFSQCCDASSAGVYELGSDQCP